LTQANAVQLNNLLTDLSTVIVERWLSSLVHKFGNVFI
jgi:hypothetical protein